MRLGRLKLAILAIACSAAPSLAGDVAVTSRNCAWCHGTSVQGFASAPRFAGQRPAYTMNQLRDFRDHTRDNPRSQQYMWGAAEGLSFHTARNLATYFSTLYPKAAGDGHIVLAAVGRARRGISGIQHRVLRRLSRAQRRGHPTNSSFGRTIVQLPEKETQGVG